MVPFPLAPLILPDRTSPSKVRFAAFRALVGEDRSGNRALLTREKGKARAGGFTDEGPLPRTLLWFVVLGTWENGSNGLEKNYGVEALPSR